ncbi:hypothetical protein LWI29_030561 [Acer saccharum]|uniref:Uncharacterized protein n=1 Tax=Acer saccharum TaxID=4024 RepID=A0AA39RJA6_ACESA|nr:hypothetical protein LWI29_030561 [Acer saccharum]
MGRQPSKKTDQKEDLEILMNHGNASDQAAKINFQAGGSDLLIRNTYNYNNKLRGVADAVLDELRLRESLRSTTYTQQYIKENYKFHAEGGLLKTKRIWMNDDVDEDHNEKRIKSDDHFVIKSEDQTLISNDDERKKTDKSSDQKKSGGGRRNLWTPELHNKFVAAISALGDKRMTKASDFAPGKYNLGNSGNVCNAGKSIPTADLAQPEHKHFVIPGKNRAANFVSGSYNLDNSGNVFNEGKSVPAFTAPPADPAPPVCPVNQDQQPSVDYDDGMKFLDEDQKGLDSGLNPDDVDRFCEWLANDLLGENAQVLNISN